MRIDHSSSVPLYQQIEDYIRELIESGEYDEGKLLPKENDIAKRFGVSRNTVRKGMYKLVMEGLLVRKKGVGTMVAPSTITTKLNEWHSFSQEMNKRGVTFKNYHVNVETVQVSKKLAQLFQIEEGEEVVKVERLRGDEQGPFVFFISWFHPRVGLTGNEDYSKSLRKLLEEEFSIYPYKSREKLKAIVASEEIAEKLSMDNDKPVLYRERQVYDAGGRIIEYNLCYYNGEKFSYSIDIERGS